jgi:hypothetical protein
LEEQVVQTCLLLMYEQAPQLLTVQVWQLELKRK